MALHLIKIVLTAVVDDEAIVIDRLTDTDDEFPGCPLNILPKLVEAAHEHGNETGTCPFCGGRATAWIVREATPDDVARFTWNALPGKPSSEVPHV